MKEKNYRPRCCASAFVVVQHVGVHGGTPHEFPFDTRSDSFDIDVDGGSTRASLRRVSG
ncbi:hypothetical protein [Dyella choica]|uniref:hypothetical protein n=1 Tax=Dyella choica TaxID=1927959 RepID=UPI0013151392|nr:hypothetical protein [Dyella choica]